MHSRHIIKKKKSNNTKSCTVHAPWKNLVSMQELMSLFVNVELFLGIRENLLAGFNDSSWFLGLEAKLRIGYSSWIKHGINLAANDSLSYIIN